MKVLSTALAAAVLVAPEAAAQVDSVRLGVMEHNICITDCKNANKESGVDINGEIRFASPAFMEGILSPHPYVMASINSDGNTSYAGFGLEWDFAIADRWHFEPGLGYIMHNGATNNPFPSGTQEAVDYSSNHVLLGSQDLFRTNLALTYDIAETWSLQAIYEHISHGQILGEGRNQGMDELGLRLVWNFK